jgi:hypothetical protein
MEPLPAKSRLEAALSYRGTIIGLLALPSLSCSGEERYDVSRLIPVQPAIRWESIATWSTSRNCENLRLSRSRSTRAESSTHYPNNPASTTSMPARRRCDNWFARRTDKLKHRMREAAERTVEDTGQRIGALIPTFSPKECANYLKNSGYPAV